MGKGRVDGITDSQVDCDLEQIMLQDDETECVVIEVSISMRTIGRYLPCVQDRRVAEDVLEVRVLLDAVLVAAGNLPVCITN